MLETLSPKSKIKAIQSLEKQIPSLVKNNDDLLRKIESIQNTQITPLHHSSELKDLSVFKKISKSASTIEQDFDDYVNNKNTKK